MKNKLILLFLSSLQNEKRDDRGFTLIEVIVAMVILSIFIVVSLSALVTGLNFKLKAKLNNDATLIINQDLENVRSTASYYGEVKTITGVPTSPATGLSTITGSGTTLPLTIPIANNGASVSYTLAQPLNITGQSSVYTATSTQTNPTTSMAVTVDLSKLNTIKKTTLASSSLALTSAISSVTVTDASYIQVGDRIVIGAVTSGANIFVTTVTRVSGNLVYFDSFTPSTNTTVGNTVSILPRVNDVIAKTTTLDGFVVCTTKSSTTSSSIAAGFIAQVSPFTTSTTLNDITYKLTRTAYPIQEPKTVTVTAGGVTTTTTSLVNSTTRAQLVYDVKQQVNATTLGPSLATLTTEVIPNVSYQCTK